MLISATENAKSGRFATLLSVLRRRVGFFPTTEQTAAIIEKIRALPNYAPVAFSIVLESHLGKKERVLGAVGSQLISEFRRASGLLMLEPDVASSKAGLSEWIRHSIGNAKNSNVEHARAVFISLLSLADRDYFPDLLFIFLRATLPSPKQKKALDRAAVDQQLARAVGKLLQGKDIKKSQIRSTLAIVSAIEDALEIERASRRKAEGQLAESREQGRVLADRVRTLEDANQNRERRIQELETEMSQLRHEIKRGEERVVELEEHWKVVVDQEVAGERHKLRQQLDHELQEANLAINRPNPNTEMAVQRLGRALKILQEG